MAGDLGEAPARAHEVRSLCYLVTRRAARLVLFVHIEMHFSQSQSKKQGCRRVSGQEATVSGSHGPSGGGRVPTPTRAMLRGLSACKANPRLGWWTPLQTLGWGFRLQKLEKKKDLFLRWLRSPPSSPLPARKGRAGRDHPVPCRAVPPRPFWACDGGIYEGCSFLPLPGRRLFVGEDGRAAAFPLPG